eukprot:COSAG02_NODE_62226_length_266_cov_0.916168_1_plen_46_part_01
MVWAYIPMVAELVVAAHSRNTLVSKTRVFRGGPRPSSTTATKLMYV